MNSRQTSTWNAASRRVLRLPAKGPREAVPGAEVHIKAGQEEARREARPQRLAGKKEIKKQTLRGSILLQEVEPVCIKGSARKRRYGIATRKISSPQP